ncbi:MAG: efflux RND transporter periplasmic adaptor subunit [Proteobacteria bacterium]|nr:efflux RND transporter periplasmic adaptor subunit [Pseudomonadota bacterium]
MINRVYILTFLLVCPTLSCHRHTDDDDDHANDHHGGHGGNGHGDHERAVEVVTHFTDKTELFVEFPVLIVGKDSPFAAHLTKLTDYKPVDSGTVVATLSGAGKPNENFEVASPSVPGIFRPVATPKHAGRRVLTIGLKSKTLNVTHDLGEFTVFESEELAEASSKEEEEQGGLISFLKEQQWKIDFQIAKVAERTIRPSLQANGTVRARSDGEVHVTAPVAGRLLTAGEAFPRLGTRVKQNQVLVKLAPRLGSGTDIALLELAVDRAQLDVDLAKREKDRLEGLLAEGAVPERRVVTARHNEDSARAELTAAQRRLRMHGRIQHTSGSKAGAGIAVRAPIEGTIIQVAVAPGAFLDEGQEMFHIVDLEKLWLEVRIPEANIGHIERTAGAWFEVEGFDKPFEVGEQNVVTKGGVVDARTRTVPLIFGIDNPRSHLSVGMFAHVYVLTDAPSSRIAIPVSAVVDDGGQDVVYVLVEGESFERRIVKLGPIDSGYIEVAQGLKTGERLVVRGAFTVKLAASRASVPAHGHAH